MAEPTFEEIKKKQRETWSSGSYGKIAWLTVPLADVLCDAVDLRSGAAVLDVATGTGHVALAAARRFCDVTGVDYVPALLDEALSRADAERLTIGFREADAESLPFPDGTFDYVLSAIGVMFTADHSRAASELVRVCRPGGRVGLVNWTPAGFIGDLLKLVSGHAPPPAGALPPTRWGSDETIRELLGTGTSTVTNTTDTVLMRLPSPEFFADFFLSNYGPTLKASQRLDQEGARTLRDDIVALADKWNQADDGTMVSPWEYQVTVADRASS